MDAEEFDDYDEEALPRLVVSSNIYITRRRGQ
jgi:hypothetical protein